MTEPTQKDRATRELSLHTCDGCVTEPPLIERYRRALKRIALCPNGDSIEDCHDQMWDIAMQALREHEPDNPRGVWCCAKHREEHGD